MDIKSNVVEENMLTLLTILINKDHIHHTTINVRIIHNRRRMYDEKTPGPEARHLQILMDKINQVCRYFRVN